MKRYRHYRGKIREHPTGQWVTFEDAHLLEVEVRLLKCERHRTTYRGKPLGGGKGYYLDGEYVGPEWQDVVAAEAAGGEGSPHNGGCCEKDEAESEKAGGCQPTRTPKSSVQDLGWANGWESEPEIVTKCKEAGHVVEEKTFKPFGFDHEVRCDECGYKYKYDSS